MSASSFQLLCDQLDKGEVSPRQAFVSAGIRVTKHEPYLISVLDAIRVIGGHSKNRDVWSKMQKDLPCLKSSIEYFHFEGARQRSTPVVDHIGFSLILVNIKSKQSALFRMKYASVIGASLQNARVTPGSTMRREVNDARTNTPGYVYMAYHPGHSDVKIGMTTKNEKSLRKQYSRPGMAHALYTEFELFGPCQNVRLAESSVHRELAHYRHSKGREWFVAEGKDMFEHFRNVIRSAVSRMDHDGHVKVGCKRPRDDGAAERASESDTPESACVADESRMLEGPPPLALPRLPSMDAAEKYRKCMVDAGLWDDDAKCVYRKAMDTALLSNS